MKEEHDEPCCENLRHFVYGFQWHVFNGRLWLVTMPHVHGFRAWYCPSCGTEIHSKVFRRVDIGIEPPA